MGKRIIRFEKNGKAEWGVLIGDLVSPLSGTYDTLLSLLENGQADIEQHSSNNIVKEISFTDLNLLSPVTTTRQIICQGANYSAHREEAGMEAAKPPFNLIFTKAASSITGPNSDVLAPEHVRLLDYEIEVGLVIKKEMTNPVEVTRDNFTEYVAGIVITNDISARDVQFTENQWYKGKSYRTFCPVGPILYLFDDDEGASIHDLELVLSVNGEVRQKAFTAQLLYKPEETLTELSSFMDFYPGDLLLTGTPGGVALKLSKEDQASLMNPFSPLNDKIKHLNEGQMGNKKYLHHGDIIVSQIKSTDGKIDLGTQRNRVVFQNQ